MEENNKEERDDHMSTINPEVEHWIKKTVYLEILRAALEWDRQLLKRTKMQHVYDLLLDQVIQHITEDLRRIKEHLQQHQAKILHEEQRAKDRFVIYRHNGYVFEKHYFNPIIKIECENLLKQYLHL